MRWSGDTVATKGILRQPQCVGLCDREPAHGGRHVVRKNHGSASATNDSTAGLITLAASSRP